jgi:ribonuclease HI
MYFDGSLKLQGAGAGILFTAPGGEHLRYALQLLFPASNNVAEYEALIHGLNIAISLGVKCSGSYKPDKQRMGLFERFNGKILHCRLETRR